MNTTILLLAEHGTADVPLEVVAAQYLGIGRKESGIIRVEVYVHREDADQIKAAAREALRVRGLA